MFIIPNDPHPSTQATLDKIKDSFGSIPPHFELFATINPKRFNLFMKEISYISTHENINPSFFIFIRLYIATKENFKYCRLFNYKMLIMKNYSKSTLQLIQNDISNIPLDEKHKKLAKAAVKAIYFPDDFTAKDISNLEQLGWTNADIFDAIDHTAFLFKNSKIIKAYSK